MGMAASQVRLLQLTSRKNTIGRELQHLSLQKTSLSRDMQRVTRDYQDALSTKTLKWSNNSGVTYVDLSYSNLMKPGTINNNQPYLITNSSGQVVLNSEYMEYAEMISPSGAPGGNYASNRSTILSQLTGIPAEDIESASNSSAALDSQTENVNALQEEVDKLEAKAQKKAKTSDFVKLLGNTSLGRMGGDAGLGNSIYNWYNNVDSSGNTKMCWSLSNNASESKNMINDFLDGIKNNMSQYLSSDDLEKFSSALEEVSSTYSNYIDAASSAPGNKGDTCPISLDNSGDAAGYYVLNPLLIINDILRLYESEGGQTATNSTDSSMTYFIYYDKNSEEYKNYEAKKAELDAAKAALDEQHKTDSQILTADQESQIEFYDKIFTAIAEKGWICNSQVEDNDYLNQMLQNNQYFITTMSAEEDADGKEFYDYDTTIASNFANIFSVNDNDAQVEAQADYEYEKSIISEKETRIDTRMQDLETEQSAINEMIKGIETQRNDNIERNFSVMS